MAKTKPLPVFCLYHEAPSDSIRCKCIKPVLDEATCRMRIENQLAIYRILYKHGNDEERAGILKEAMKLKAGLR